MEAWKFYLVDAALYKLINLDESIKAVPIVDVLDDRWLVFSEEVFETRYSVTWQGVMGSVCHLDAPSSLGMAVLIGGFSVNRYLLRRSCYNGLSLLA